MRIAADTSILEGFSKAGVHSITYKDNFCGFASEIREELLRFQKWKEMEQQAPGGGGVINSRRQNGITTGHIREEDREQLPFCVKFRDFLAQNLAVLCSLANVNPADAHEIEINAMAYGAGAWLSPHTDCFDPAHSETRLVAWMLYLTAPEDGEWQMEKGGAVRVWKPGDAEERVRPLFNRFAMFRVHNQSFHEIEKVTWEPEWPNCRLALSGWIAGRQAPVAARKTRIYLQSISFQARKEEVEASLVGSLALYRLLKKQKNYCGRDVTSTVEQISDLEQDYQAHIEAPQGTSFVRRAAGPAGCIIVVNEAGDTIHFGTLEDFATKKKA